MNGNELLRGLSFIDERFVEEAESPQVRKRFGAKIGIAVAACLGIVALAAALISGFGGGELPAPDGGGVVLGVTASPEVSSAPEVTKEPYTPGTVLEAPAVMVDMGGVFVNEMDALFVDAAQKPFDPELYETVYFTAEETEEYFGLSFAPAYLPEDITPSPANGGMNVVRSRDGGAVAAGTLYLSFYEDYYEDGSPRSTDEVPYSRGFTAKASKTGIASCCVYLLPENEVKTSEICGVEVTIGYREMTYGPYDPETKEPSGFYDLYVAEFELDGIDCEILAQRMTLGEVVKVVASVISGESSIETAE